MLVAASVLDAGVASAREDSSAGKVAGSVEVMTKIVSEALDEGELKMVT